MGDTQLPREYREGKGALNPHGLYSDVRSFKLLDPLYIIHTKVTHCAFFALVCQRFANDTRLLLVLHEEETTDGIYVIQQYPELLCLQDFEMSFGVYLL